MWPLFVLPLLVLVSATHSCDYLLNVVCKKVGMGLLMLVRLCNKGKNGLFNMFRTIMMLRSDRILVHISLELHNR